MGRWNWHRKKRYGHIEPTETGAEIFFNGTKQSLGHELGGHGFMLDVMMHAGYIEGLDPALISASFRDRYNNDEEFRINQERDAAEVGGHEFNEDYYRD